MKPFRWAHEKNETLKSERSISFEEIALAIEADGLLDILRHPNPEKYPNQSLLVVAFEGYVYLVPFVEEPVMTGIGNWAIALQMVFFIVINKI